jgi:hypothetical protein
VFLVENLVAVPGGVARCERQRTAGRRRRHPVSLSRSDGCACRVLPQRAGGKGCRDSRSRSDR